MATASSTTATSRRVNFIYPAGDYTATVKVTDPHGASDTDSVAIHSGNTPPSATITAPSPSLTWKVGDPIDFAATATDSQETLPASAYHWQEIINHCPSNCHQHFVQDFIGPTGSLIAPDHEYPSNLELRLTVTDSGGLTDVESVIVNPKTVDLTVTSVPAGLQLGVNSKTATAPWVCTVIQGSQNVVIAPTPQTLNGSAFSFASWSDLGAASHTVIANQSQTLTATYDSTPPPPPGSDLALNRPSSASSVEGTGLEPGKANDGNSGTRWSSAFSDNQWWQVDLGSVQQVNQVRLNWESAYASHYKIQTSTDGTNFTDAADVNIASPGVQTTTFAARDARYVRVLGVTRATQWGYSFFDAEVYGPSQPPPGSDLALNKPASSLSVEAPGLEPGKANDGNSGTRWSSAFSDNQWWQVDLGSAQQVDTVKLNWESAFAAHYLIQTSTDGTNFTQAADVTDSVPGPKTTTFTARSARYVRVLGLTRATQWGFSFFDASVFGPAG